MASKRPSYTTSEQRSEWMKRNYKKYVVSLRYDTDQDLIDFIEANKERLGTTSVFRDALKAYVKKER